MSTIIIPARLKSKRFPNKINAIMPNGKTMIEWMHDTALNTTTTNVYIATDSIYVAGYFNNSILTNTDHANGTSRILEVINKQQIPDTELIINLQADEVTLTPQHINALINIWNDQKDIDILTACIETKTNHNPNDVKVVTNAKNEALYFSRATIPHNSPTNKKHIGIYLYNANTVKNLYNLPASKLEQAENLEQLRALENGLKIKVHQLDQFKHISIDTERDYQEFMDEYNV